MQREIVTIPPNFLRVLNVDWDIDWRGQSVGDATSGSSATVYNSFPRWVGSPKVSLVRDEITQWRAIRAQAQGRVGIYRMEMVDPLGFIAPDVNPNGVSFSGGGLFNGGSGFAYTPICRAVNPAGAGATEIRLDVAGEAAPVVGQIMSHDDWPFVVVWASLVSGNVYDVGIQMPLRADIAVNDLINLRGVGRFEAVDESAGNPAYDRRRVSSIQLSFREVLSR
ncbi:hypothetical protein DL239_20155 [Sedimentitalea sp. CY04]|uniref:Uncharacterized protein n=1 Tax=Parasedimentitalea denitrificans TaxID=2211118 RepID=A0ABX0WCA5_9RHOB|nr:hypothetical protein [Sedimentitalea sp. CY04]NIZ63284.1 hypothetical protein [Sedimentitalea sp. CY04]